MSRILLAIVIALAVGGTVQQAATQTYATRPITLIVPFPPGGSTSIVARIIGEKMSETLGQPVIIDHRGGAGGTIGTRAAAKSAPDGHTFLLSYTATMAVGPNLLANAGYDPRTDFEPIGRIGATPLVIVVHPDVKANSVADLIKLVKTTREPFQYGSPGVGSLGHLAGELLAHQIGSKLAHIPYKGTGPMMTDLLGGHIKMSFANVPVSHANASVGKLRALAVASSKRSSMLPDVPTAAESGLPGYEAEVLYGLVAPAKTPKPIVERLNKELRAALATDVVRKLLATEGIEALSSTPEEYASDIDREETAWAKLIRSIGIQPEK